MERSAGMAWCSVAAADPVIMVVVVVVVGMRVSVVVMVLSHCSFHECARKGINQL